MKTSRSSILSFLFTCCLYIFISYDALPQVNFQSDQQQKSSYSSDDALQNSTITYKLISGINKTWGYDILVENKVKIHQPNIPGLPGNEGFKTKEGAEKVAKMVITKMKAGEMPPTITNEEMKKLNAI